MPLGRAAIESYKLVKRHTVFSHDELVCKIATNKDLIDINTAFSVQRELKIIYENEKKDREYLIEKVSGFLELFGHILTTLKSIF